jgi:carbonic anhydrase
MVRKKYIENLKSFREDFFRENRKLFRQLEEGQSPDTMMITCSDSRIVPHMKTGAYPGDMFLFRNMGNFVSPYQEGKDDTTGVAAFLEYGTQMLGAKYIIVMGHTNCGAIKGIFKKSEEVEKSSFIKSWLRNGELVKRIVIENFGEDDGDGTVEMGFRENVKLQVENIRSFPFIRDAIQKKQITIHGWLYDVKSGGVYYLDDKNGEFQPLT